MSKLPIITAEMLEAKDACPDQVAIFRKHWPNGARPLLRTIRKAARLGLDLEWFIEGFLTASAWAAYRETEASASAVYGETEASALAVYGETEASALAVYEEATASALYDAIRKHGLKT